MAILWLSVLHFCEGSCCVRLLERITNFNTKYKVHWLDDGISLQNMYGHRECVHKRIRGISLHKKETRIPRKSISHLQTAKITQH